MGPVDLEHEMTTILCAEIKGYGRFTNEYEILAVRSCLRHHGIAIRPDLKGEEKDAADHTKKVFQEVATVIQQHRGIMVISNGDRMLAKFTTVVDAFNCAVEIQQLLNDKNAQLPKHQMIEFRIGINFGSVIENEDQIYDGEVIISKQLANLAEKGGIFILASAHEQIEKMLQPGYEIMDKHILENLPKPIKVFRIQTKISDR
jgi:adenylate cyclase